MRSIKVNYLIKVNYHKANYHRVNYLRVCQVQVHKECLDHSWDKNKNRR